MTVLILFFAFVVVAFWVVADGAALTRRLRMTPLYSLAARSLWLLVAVAGLVALVKDIDALT